MNQSGWLRGSAALAALLLTLGFAASGVARSEVPTVAQMTAAERALAGWDDETGLWLPDPALKSAYLSRDPSHPLIQQLQEILGRDPELLDEVIALLQDPRRTPSPSNLTPQDRQLKTMFDMFCIGLKQSQEQSRQRKIDEARRLADFRSWFDRSAATKLSTEERDGLMRELWGEQEHRPSDDRRLRTAFRMVGLTPAVDSAMSFLLSSSPYRMADGGGPMIESLREALSAEGDGDDPESLQYRMALRNLEMYEGHYEKALAMTTAILEGQNLDEFPGNVFQLAFLERVGGRPEPLKAWLARCVEKDGPSPPGARPAGAACRDLLFWATRRNIQQMGARSSAVLADILFEATGPEPANWPMRCETIRALPIFAPDRAWQGAEEMLRIPATIVPLGARLDAIGVKARVAWNRKQLEIADAIYQTYLDQVRFRPPPVPADLWRRLTAVPGPPAKDPESWTFQDSPSDTTWVLSARVQLAVESSDPVRARRALERYLQATLALDSPANEGEALFDLDGMREEDRRAFQEYLRHARASLTEAAHRESRAARWLLESIADLDLRLGHLAEARRIAAFLLTQPRPSGPPTDRLAELLDQIRSSAPESSSLAEPEPEAAPWDLPPGQKQAIRP